MFQSTPSHGGRRGSRVDALHTIEFQSTPSHGGRQRSKTVVNSYSSFNPRPRTEGDDARRCVVTLRHVSIHALARRATCQRKGPPCTNLCFNPRPRTEGDQYVSFFQFNPNKTFQSTPSHGGRPDGTVTTTETTCFNPRPRTEGDTGAVYTKDDDGVFQSTPSHGGRPRIMQIRKKT